MRVAVVAEAFPPQVNGVAHSALRTADHLFLRGHAPLVIAPSAPRGTASPGKGTGGTDHEEPHPYPVVRVPSLSLPGYGDVRAALPSRRAARAIAAHRADLVHLAGPFLLGADAMKAARGLGIPAVAVYQTDIAAYARLYTPWVPAGPALAWYRLRAVHNAADLTLALSGASRHDLEEHGVPRVRLWSHGVDSVRFHPRHRDPSLRRRLAPEGEVLIGYVGRLAPEKRVELLAETCALPGVRVVVVGDGPSGARLRRALPRAVFLGRRTGDDLARIFASLDVFVHTGPFETFCQTIQEAMASGLPVIAPASGGPLDLVDHERTGLLVPPGDASATRDAVRALAGSVRTRVALGRAGRAAVADRSWEAVGDQLLRHYARVLGERAGIHPV
ncbi:glycosyltransferase family 4 protein [Streptomyces yaizuensis]|uniref:glycosyltransferase family 4 protein n=1 Tax=Streptomyces yaizuensis TaxID=2989713 RepID=UPI002B203B69|nr:glycosyltransferase family 1 protein [Streptomyces sp. YSPA8]